jgi:hypothetical protein
MALRSDRLDPICERLHELQQEFAGAVADELAVLIEEPVGMTDIGFGLLHGRHVQKHERLRQRLLAPIAPGEPLTIAPGLWSQTLLPCGLKPTSRAFFRTAGTDRLYSGHKQRRISSFDTLPERGPWRRRKVDQPLKVLIVERQLPDLDDFGFHR